jgi:serine/threonine protein kinase
MTPERWRRVKSLFERALDHPPSTRDELLEVSDESPSVVAEVRELIARDALAGSFLAEAGSLELSAAAVASPGELVSGHFRIVSLLGRGGMGVVYRAEDLVLQRAVALKFLADGRTGTTQALERMKREARAASALSHPNIVTIHEIGEQDGRTFIVMELVNGKPLNELIPRKGLRLNEALRIAAQVADALAAAHAAGIVHRDLKPGNIMVDVHGRVRVLDFGLAKLTAPTAPVALSADEATRTLAVEQAMTEEGVIVGSVPYMSPEQVEGKPVDSRSDIFSFGAVLYEMITGQRAFSAGSRASTLSAILERDPPPLSEISPSSVPELERLISRCLRKDVNRRSQNMADVKLALEELRDESESGKLARSASGLHARKRPRHWLWLGIGSAVVLVAAAAAWLYYPNPLPRQLKGPELIRASPDDGHSYTSAAISPDGGLLAFVSDRSGKDELWLQQVGGGDPIQLTHFGEQVEDPVFFPDGKRILYVRRAADEQTTALEVIPALGGDPRVLTRGTQIWNEDPKLSPDGRLIAYYDVNQNKKRLMTISSDGGQPRELPAWGRFPLAYRGRAAWTSDSRYLLCLVAKKSNTANAQEFEWFGFPVDGGEPLATGVSEALRVAGLGPAAPFLMVGDRALFAAGSRGPYNVWEISLSAGSLRVQGVPHQLTFGTLTEFPASVSGTGTLALLAGDSYTDFYAIPLSPVNGQPAGVVRRLTQDSRTKNLLTDLGGSSGSAYFEARDQARDAAYALDLESGKQTLMTAMPPLLASLAISPEGRQVAYSIPEGDSYSIRIGDAGASAVGARVLCQGCGFSEGFSPDGKFLFYTPEAKVRSDPKRKRSVRLLDVASGKDRPWLERPTDSAFVSDTFGRDSKWLYVGLNPASGPSRRYLVPWKAELAPESEWIKVPWSSAALPEFSPTGNFVYFFEGSKLMMVRFHPEKKTFSEPQEVKFVPGSVVKPTPDEPAKGDLGPPRWAVRGPGLVFSRQENIVSVWLTKLPR